MSSMFSLEGKNAAIVGAASGIGEAVAIGCAEQGAYVACLDLDADGATRTADTIRGLGGEAHAERVDILDGAGVRAALEAVRDSRGSLDVVVCTPAINFRKRLLDYTDEEMDRVLGLNLKGNAHVLQAAGRVMAAQGSGPIILFSSIRSLVVEPGQSIYAATKAGIVQLVRTSAAELGPSGVRVNAVAPGVIDTPLTRPIKDAPEWYRAYAEHLQAVGHPAGDGGAHGVPRVGRRQLRDRHRPLRRRRVDSDRRQVHPARDVSPRASAAAVGGAFTTRP